VKKPWHCSNKYQALGQMLTINQCLDKLAAICSNFIACGMLPAGHPTVRNVSLILMPHQAEINNIGAEDDDEGPVEEENIDGHISLAHTCGTSISAREQPILTFSSVQLSTRPRRPFNSHR